MDNTQSKTMVACSDKAGTVGQGLDSTHRQKGVLDVHKILCLLSALLNNLFSQSEVTLYGTDQHPNILLRHVTIVTKKP